MSLLWNLLHETFVGKEAKVITPSTGLNHKYVYILGQRPVFERLGIRVRGKLHCVNKWLRDYVRMYDKNVNSAQRVIRLAYMRMKLFRAMCASFPLSMRPKYLRLLHPLMQGMFSSSMLFYPTMHPNQVYKHKKIDATQNYYDELVHLNIVQYARKYGTYTRKLPIMSSNSFGNIGFNALKYISTHILGGTNRRLVLYEEKWEKHPFFEHALHDRTTFARLYVNFPCWRTYCSWQFYVEVLNCMKAKYVLFGTVHDMRTQQKLENKVHTDKNHKFIVDEYDSAGKLVQKSFYYNEVEVSSRITVRKLQWDRYDDPLWWDLNHE